MYSTKTQNAAPRTAVKARFGIPRIRVFFIWEQHFCPDDARDSEHETHFYVETDEDEKSGPARRAPDGSIIGEMEYLPIDNLI
jgi:hypothetical protein